MSDIDVNLYDRQIRTYGMDAIKKITSSSILIYGLSGGLGTEIAKNLALGGVKNLYLYDDNKINNNDLITGYYYKYSDIDNIRSHVLSKKISELNPYCSVKFVSTHICKQDVTILINQPNHIVSKIGKMRNIISVYSHKLNGSIFVDAGEHHIVTDTTSENIEPVQIGKISKDGIVYCSPNNTHDYQDNNTIYFDNLQGENLDFLKQQFKIKVINRSSFKLLDFPESIDFKFINGTSYYYKVPQLIEHLTFDKLSSQVPDYINSEENLFMPVVSIIGSFAAAEAIKLISNKYLPFPG